MKKNINFGIVGTGQMAATMMEAFKHLPNVNVMAVCGSAEDRTKKFASDFAIPKVFLNLEDFLKNKEIDVVYIANATEHHAPTTIAALKMEKAVLCEKPIAISESECKEIELAARKAGKLCMEAMWTHCLPAYQAFFQEAQALDQPKHLFADFGYPVSENLNPRLFSASSGSGVLLDRAVYPIALATKLFGTATAVESHIIRNQAGVDVHANLLLKHENGCTSSLAVSLQALLQNKAVLSSSQGSVSLEPPLLGAEAMLVQGFNMQTQPFFESKGLKGNIKKILKQSSLLRFFKSKKKSGKSSFYTYGANQYLPLLTHFCALLNNGKLQSDWIPLTLSSEVLRVIDLTKSNQESSQ